MLILLIIQYNHDVCGYLLIFYRLILSNDRLKDLVVCGSSKVFYFDEVYGLSMSQVN